MITTLVICINSTATLKEAPQKWIMDLEVTQMHTWPYSLIRVSEIFRRSHKHLSVCHWRPERHHVVVSVVPNGGIFFWIHS